MHWKNKKWRLRWGRSVVQIIFFLLAPALFSQAFGGIKEVFTALGSGAALHTSSFLLCLVILCGLTIVFGRIFCGWMCAFGAVGDWIYQFSVFLQKKTGKKLPKIPKKALPILQKLKYIVLVLVLALCFAGQSGGVTKYSPWTVFSLITAGNLKLGGYGTAFVLFILILIGMAIQERFFCQFLCPMGAVFSLLPEIPFLKLRRKADSCIPNCQACKNNCPVHIKLEENPLQEGECIRCGRCTQICPRANICIGISKNDQKSDKTIEA